MSDYRVKAWVPLVPFTVLCSHRGDTCPPPSPPLTAARSRTTRYPSPQIDPKNTVDLNPLEVADPLFSATNHP